MNIIDTAPHWTGRIAQKTKGLKAMPLRVCLFSMALPYFAIATREGYIKPDPDCLLCVGEDDEPWQQLPEKLNRDYDVVGVDGAWVLYHPKPTKRVEFIEVTPSLLEQLGRSQLDTLYIVGQWGETIDGVANLQRLRLGDFIARQLHDPSDQWVVQRGIWLRTYAEVSPLGAA